MNALMPLQSSGVTEGSLTVDTDVRFFPTVDPQVSLEISYEKTVGECFLSCNRNVYFVSEFLHWS